MPEDATTQKPVDEEETQQQLPAGNDATNDAQANDGEGGTASAQTQQSGSKDYEKIVAGLNRTISRKDNEIANLRKQVEELRSALAEKDDEVKTLGESRQRIAQLEKEVDEKTKELARKKLIMRKFPGLSELEAEGLLPDADTEEELEKRLSALNEKMSSLIDKAAQSRSVGTVPRHQEDGIGNMSDVELADRAMKAVRDNDTETYEKIMAVIESRK